MSKNSSGLRRGDAVRVISSGATGTAVIRTKKDDGEPVQHHYRLDDLERLPDTKERLLVAEAHEKHEREAGEKDGGA